VIVQPTEDRAYTIFAETLDRSGYARGTLAPRAGMSAAIPPRRPRPLRTMEDMGMIMHGDMAAMKLEMGENAKAGGREMSGMDMGSKGHDMNMPGMKPSGGKSEMPEMQPGAKTSPTPSGQHDMHNMPGMPNMPAQHEMKDMPPTNARSEIPGSTPVKQDPDMFGSGNQATPEITRARLDDPGIGLGGEGRRVLVYTDLQALERFYDTRKPERELVLHATGNMERFIWSFEGKKFSQDPQPIHFRSGERLRWTFVNDTMMEHTFHLHGLWMHLENGKGELLPRKHTVIVKPAERVSVAITADAPGRWAFHCHLLLHMEAGMFRVVEVSDRKLERQS
jgi:FtsP/CotA-like multicopper oxidase with cupredoxin domain